MSKSYLTISQAYTKLGLSGGGSSFIRKSELVATGKCDTSKLTKYGNNDYVVDDDIIKISSTSNIDALNKFVSGRYYSAIGKNYNNDGRIVFSYQDSTLNLNNVGIVNENGTIWTFHVLDNGYASTNYNNRCMPPFLIGDYVFYRNGTGTRKYNYMAIINIKTNKIVWSNNEKFKYVCPLVYGMINSNGLVEFYNSISESYRPMLNIVESTHGSFDYNYRDDRKISIGGSSFMTSILPLYKLSNGYYRCIIYNATTENAYCVGDIADIKKPNSSANRLVKLFQSNCFPHSNYQCNIVGEKYLFNMYNITSQYFEFYDWNVKLVGKAYFSNSSIGNYAFIVLNDTFYSVSKTLGATWQARTITAV